MVILNSTRMHVVIYQVNNYYYYYYYCYYCYCIVEAVLSADEEQEEVGDLEDTTGQTVITIE